LGPEKINQIVCIVILTGVHFHFDLEDSQSKLGSIDFFGWISRGYGLDPFYFSPFSYHFLINSLTARPKITFAVEELSII
jgi:hypothetical protein